MKKALGLAIPTQQAEETLRALRKRQLVNMQLEFSRTEKQVIIPILHEPSVEDIQAIKEHCATFNTQQALFRERKHARPSLLESVRGKIPERYLSHLPRSFDIVGEVATVELPSELDEFSSIVGRGIMEANPHVRLVIRKSGDVSGKYRTRQFETIAGSGGTETWHREYSCVLHLDIAKVYFNPRLSHERMRVAQQVRAHETVLDMFAGVGPYSILIAKNQPTSRVYSIDINPDAFRYLKENILANGVADRVIPILGDAREATARQLKGVASRVIMNLPSEARNFLEAAARALTPESGTLHYYAFASRTDDLDTIKKSIRATIGSTGRIVHSFSFCRIIKEIAPSRVQVAIDVQVK